MILLITAAIAVFLLSTLLVFLVFLQNPKDQGGNSVLLGSGMRQMIGVAHSSNVLEKATYVLAGMIFILTLLISSRIEKRKDKTVEKSTIVTRLEKQAKEDKDTQKDK